MNVPHVCNSEHMPWPFKYQMVAQPVNVDALYNALTLIMISKSFKYASFYL